MTGPGNAERAAWAAQAIEAFQSAAGHHGGLDTAEAAGNLITALCHYADRRGISFGAILAASSDAYLSQRASEQHAYKPGDEVRIRDGAVLAPSPATMPRPGPSRPHRDTASLAELAGQDFPAPTVLPPGAAADTRLAVSTPRPPRGLDQANGRQHR